MNGSSGSETTRPTQRHRKFNARRTSRRNVLKRNPSAKISQLGFKLLHFDSSVNFLQPRGRFFYLHSGQPQVQQLVHGKRAAPVRHRHDDAVHSALPRQIQQMRAYRLASEFPLKVPCPSHHFDSEFRALPQPVQKLLGSISRSQHVDSLTKIFLLDKP